MYQTARTSLESAPIFDSNQLANFQALVTSCLSSRHKLILNQSILMWNRTFGAADRLKYPEELQKTLSKLKAATDIRLPDFPDIKDSEVSWRPT